MPAYFRNCTKASREALQALTMFRLPGEISFPGVFSILGDMFPDDQAVNPGYGKMIAAF